MKTAMKKFISRIDSYETNEEMTIIDRMERAEKFIEILRKRAYLLLKPEKEQMVKFAFDFYYDMSHQNKVPENYITENREHAEIYFDNNFNPKQHQ